LGAIFSITFAHEAQGPVRQKVLFCPSGPFSGETAKDVDTKVFGEYASHLSVKKFSSKPLIRSENLKKAEKQKTSRQNLFVGSTTDMTRIFRYASITDCWGSFPWEAESMPDRPVETP
jgi:hypothetical protein